MDKNQLLEKANSAQKPVIVDFWAPWCGPCRMTKPILNKLAKEYDGRVEFWAINADAHQELLRELKVFGIPTIIAIQNGDIVSRVTGAQSESKYRVVFEALSKGEKPTQTLSFIDRFIRLSIGVVATSMALNTQTWWALPIGLLVLFSGVYDRCPVWKAITTYLNSKKAS